MIGLIELWPTAVIMGVWTTVGVAVALKFIFRRLNLQCECIRDIQADVIAILGLFSSGDGSVRTAAANGGISEVKHIDYEYKNVLGIYQRYTTVVYGN